LLTSIDSLIHRGALIIVTLRRDPQATPRLMPQLASRLAGGLVVKLATPGTLARHEIVRQAAASTGLRLTDGEVSHLAGDGIAHYVTSTKLRRAVLELAAATDFDRHASRPEALRAISDRDPEPKTLFRLITIAVARHFAVPTAELKSKSRRKTVADARGLAMYLARQLTGASYAQLGRYFGGRDHTTVLHACRKIAAALADDVAFAQIAEELAAQAAAEGAH
jgi:chromosomal replication initiator protein